METILHFTKTLKRFNIVYTEVKPFINQMIIKFDEVAMNAIYDDGVVFTVDLVFKVPGKEKVNKRVTISKENITTNSWVEIIYAGEFLREVTVFSSNYVKENSEIKFSINELKSDLEKTKINEDQLLHYILTDNWYPFLESIRKLSADDLKSFIAKHLNHIQEINGPSAELIEYVLAKQIIEFWGTGAIEIDQVDLAAEAYANGYDFIKKNNQLVIENYEKLDWEILNTRLSERSEQVTREYCKLKEKIDMHLKDESVWKKVLKRRNDFTVDAEQIYYDYADVIDNLITSNSLKNFEILFQDWIVQDEEQEAKIIIQSTLPFGATRFRFELLFKLEMNPTTYQQEFTLTLSDRNTVLSSEKLKHTKVIHQTKTREDLQAIHNEGSIRIEKEFYNILRDLISGSIIYRNSDFQTIKQDSNNEFSDEDRQRISKDAADLLNRLKNMPGNNFTCGRDKGLEKQKELFKNQTEFNESERRTRNILISRVNKANLLKVLDETSSHFQSLNLKSPKYSVTHGKSFLAEDSVLYSQIYIQPKQPTFFNSKVGNKKDVELFALTVTVQLLAEESEIKIEIMSHFNPDIFRNVKLEYIDVVTTGVNRHLQLVLPESIATEELKNNITHGLNESISYYFK